LAVTKIKELFRRLSRRAENQAFSDDLAVEIQFHIDARAEELERAGMPRADALLHARREFGSVARTREDSRAAWQFKWIEDLISDMRYGVRALRRSPGFAVTAVLSLAIGIGANTTVFSLMMEFLFSEPSCRNCESLVRTQLGGNSHAPVTHYQVLRDARVFDELAGYREEAEANWRYGGESFRLGVMRVTDNYFDLVGIPVLMGRGLHPGERDAVVVSYRFWQNRLNADPQVLSRSLVIDGRPHTVTGVLPRDHRTLLGFGFAPFLYLPVVNQQEKVALIGRQPAGVPRAVLLQRVAAASTELNRMFADPGMDWSNNPTVDPVAGTGRLRNTSALPLVAFFAMLMVLVGLVLLIACTNVASLLLARASSRRQELAVRLALGASRGRVVRQLLAESLLLAFIGAACGLILNTWLTSFMSRIDLPVPIPVQLLIEPDWRLLTYAALVAVAAALVAGLLPAVKSTRAGVNDTLKLSDRQVGLARWDLRKLLVGGQIAVSVLLLATGVLFLRNLLKTTATSPGFDVEKIVWTAVRVVPERYTDGERIRLLKESILERLRALPGVESASITRVVPFNDHNRMGSEIRTDLNDKPVHLSFTANRVGPDFFRTMGIPLIAGREFRVSEPSKPDVVILNGTFARRAFGNRNPVGHTIQIWSPEPKLIVGVVANIKHFTMGEENVLALYEPYVQATGAGVRAMNLHFMLRAPDSAATFRAIQATVAELDSSAAVEVKAMSRAMGFALLPSQVGAALLGAMGVLGLLLATVGLYGVLAYVVARRIREIGVRVALGASPRSVLAMVFRQSAALVVTGMSAGFVIAFFAMKPLAMFLVPGLSPADPLTLVSVVLVLAGAACIATLGPALRALRVDPMTALRYE
jgi:predicted permease